MVREYVNVKVNQVENNAGGLVFKTSSLEHLERFLILGSDTGTFYATPQKLTLENAKNINHALDTEGIKAVDMIVEIGRSGRAMSHEPVLFALAVAASHSNPDIRKAALDNMNAIVRTGTHLFHFVTYAHTMRGWGRAFRRALSNWYLDKNPEAVAVQVMKYKQRDGWSHRDILRVAHPKTSNEEMDAIFKFVTTGNVDALGKTDSHEWILAAKSIEGETDIRRIVEVIEKYRLPREVVPTSALTDKRVWEAMLPDMGYHALLRNLRNMVNYGVIEQGSEATKVIIDRLGDSEAIRRARVHPADIFKAQNAVKIKDYYDSYVSDLPTPQGLLRVLEEAFYESFETVEPTGKSILTALDVSGSMNVDVGRTGATAAEWTALLAMVTARTEPNAEFVAFSDTIVEFPLLGNESMSEILLKMRGMPFSSTDTSLPMYWARQRGRRYDAFFVYTDNDTWDRGSLCYGRRGFDDSASSGDTSIELDAYRRWRGTNDIHLGVVGMTSTGFTVGDPDDKRTYSVVGMDSSVPATLSNLIR